MTKISLRAYIQEINQLIDNKNIADAIEHCKHILKQYPKHLEIYRLLGQAYLETGEYQEAADMFLRVLSVSPDDFIAQVGLSMIMEEQGDIDSAIWHMERAYEVRNTQAIHEELHRLYLMRDGAAPAKPMITRGTLIRINIRSGLYQQALQEIQRALASDPSRIDLTILQARIHYMQSNTPRTIATCEKILAKLPFSYEANSLMAEIYGDTPESEPYKQKLYELNPYTSFVTDTSPIDHVPDNVIRLEKLNLEDAYQDNFSLGENGIQLDGFSDEFSQPESTKTASKTEKISLQPTDTDDDGIGLPGFLSEDDADDNFDDSTILEAQPGTQEEIPEWMKQAGWGAAQERSNEEQQELIQTFDQINDFEELSSTDPVETEIPEWLQSIAPAQELTPLSDSEDSLNEYEADQNDENLDWLNDILTNSTASQTSVESEEKRDDTIENNQSDILEEEQQPEFGADLDTDMAWLEEITSPEAVTEKEVAMEENLYNDEEFDDMNSDDADNGDFYPLEDVNENAEATENFEQTEENSEEIETSVFSEEVLQVSEMADDDDDFDMDSALSWLEGLAAKQGADEETLSTTPEDRLAETPDFLRSDELAEEPIFEETMPEPEGDLTFAQETPYKPELEEVPDWLKEENYSLDQVPENESGLEGQSKTEEIEFPSLQEDDIFDDSLEIDEEEEEEATLPPWLKAVAPPEHIQEEVEEELPDEDLEESLLAEDPIIDRRGQRAADHPTMALDFIKDDDNGKEEEIDEWLKNLPDMDWDIDSETKDQTLTSDSESESEPEEVEEETFETPSLEAAFESEIPEEITEESTEFIDDLFSETTEDEQLSDEPGSPYIWENEFTDQDTTAPEMDTPIPDWISGISEDTEDTEDADQETSFDEYEEPDDSINFEETKVEETEEVTEVENEFPLDEISDDELPDWMLDTSEFQKEEIVQSDEISEDAPDQLTEEELTETVSEEDIQQFIDMTSDSDELDQREETLNIPSSELDELNKTDKDIIKEPAHNTEDTSTAPTVVLESEPVESLDEAQFVEEQEELEPAPEQISELSDEEILESAREDLLNGKFEEALSALDSLLKQKKSTNKIIDILKFDIENYHPIHVDTWVLLGDAYMQEGELEKALDAYLKAEDFIY